MKNFFKMMFASTLGVFIAGIILTFVSFFIFIGIAASLGSSNSYVLQDNSVLKINLDGAISEREIENPFQFLFSSSSIDTYGLNDILSAIEKAKSNNKIKGIYIEAGQTMTGYASMEPIRKALLDFKENGKFVVAYGESFNHRSYYVCSAADQVFMNPQGVLDFRGLATSIQFNKGVLQKWGIEMQVFKVGTYKSAVEPYILDKMSDANRQQITAFLGDIWANLLKGISESRNLTIDQLNAYADECITFTAPEKLTEYKLIDGLKYKDEVESFLKNELGVDAKDDINTADVREMQLVPESKKKISPNKIAVLYAEGDIVDDVVPSIYGQTAITAQEYVKELNRLKDDDDVKAVVFRVNSPGGSAYASEQIWRAVKNLREVKPVVVSMGSYAASGGYYISCGANKIVAEPTTLTGSIGIFGLIPNGAELAKRMGATFDGVETNKHSNFAGDVLSIPLFGVGLLPARPLNAGESAMVQAHIERFYDLFLTRVSEGRGKTKAAVDSIGQGRVWSGNKALALGLVDELGGIDTAIKAAAELAETSDYAVKEYPAVKDFFTRLLEESTGSIRMQTAQLFMGKDAYQLQQTMQAWQHYDYRQAIMTERMD
ncbi:MAG: signal peptide peptidase SppA [Candidatus Symbiothrix sp.]|jgi:protease-4|nr:signal peptide peptidase SppA [Candidatus Symbiothrix sp.]